MPAKSRIFERTPESKSLFASFSSEKEDSCSFLKKRTKRLLFLGVGFENPGPGRDSWVGGPGGM
jgi:hypothetical protein